MNFFPSIAAALGLAALAGGCAHTHKVSKTRITSTATRPIIPAATVTYIPPKVREGDRDFAGHGPRVQCNVVVGIIPRVHGGNEVIRAITMEATETRHGHTRVSGSKIDVIYSTPSDSLRFADSQDTFASVEYTDRNHADDVFRRGTSGLVKEFRFVGDTPKGEAGSKTKVTVTLNPIRLIEAP